MPEVVWKSSELKPGSDFSSIKKLIGTYEPLTKGSWGEESPYGDNPYEQINLCDVEILEMDGDVPAPQLVDDKFSYRINLSERTGTKWDTFLKAAEELKLELPDGITGKRVISERVAVGKGRKATTVLVPVALVEVEQVDPIEKVRQLLASTNSVKVFKRACMLDPTIAKDEELLEKISSGSIFAELGAVVEGETYMSAEPTKGAVQA